MNLLKFYPEKSRENWKLINKEGSNWKGRQGVKRGEEQREAREKGMRRGYWKTEWVGENIKDRNRVSIIYIIIKLMWIIIIISYAMRIVLMWPYITSLPLQLFAIFTFPFFPSSSQLLIILFIKINKFNVKYFCQW